MALSLSQNLFPSLCEVTVPASNAETTPLKHTISPVDVVGGRLIRMRLIGGERGVLDIEMIDTPNVAHAHL